MLEKGDAIHGPITFTDQHGFEPTTGPDWQSIDYHCDGLLPEEETITKSDAAAVISILTGWLCHSYGDAPADIRTVAAKCEALLYWLDPNQSKYSSLTEIAEACQLTRAAVSKQLLNLKDQIGSCVSAGKMSSSRETYRDTQRRLVHEGRHASDTRRLKKLAQS
jgi:hypothetical protein